MLLAGFVASSDQHLFPSAQLLYVKSWPHGALGSAVPAQVAAEINTALLRLVVQVPGDVEWRGGGITRVGEDLLGVHCCSAPLHRYLAEFDFRFNHRVALGVNDGHRADTILRGVIGKRLTQ